MILNDFKEKANKFLKDNYGIENYIDDNDFKISVLKFYTYISDNYCSDFIDKVDQISNIILSDIVLTDYRKLIEIIIFNFLFERIPWSYSGSNLSFMFIKDISESFTKREEEIKNLFLENTEEYLKLFGSSKPIETKKKELDYCLQDIKSNKFLISICFEFIIDKCLKNILYQSSYDKSTRVNFEEFLNIITT